ncbi:hypothetical protein PE066_00595 [Ramlibacter tataouinensis]|uniref:hypothetical protein n=1 Tax=Ramlibacter tataouinensis TaxID=94132 RepID=UPI0022F3C6C8|nr:hypothetical protein [Ramlibacter tataouinensis]WBY02071.1 hypothetical protein PE066_00595 [Ramlibacter tataouinensis]
MKRSWKLAAGACLVAVLVACGGGGGGGAPATPVAVDIGAITLSATTGPLVAQALVGQTITLPNGLTLSGVPLPGPVTLTFTAGNGFTLKDGNNNTITGTVTFSSIIFDVTDAGGTPVPTGPAPALPFAIDLDTANQPANGSSTTVQSTITIGGSTSTPVSISVVITSSGSIQIGGQTVGTVSVKTPTGAS